MVKKKWNMVPNEWIKKNNYIYKCCIFCCKVEYVIVSVEGKNYFHIVQWNCDYEDKRRTWHQSYSEKDNKTFLWYLLSKLLFLHLCYCPCVRSPTEDFVNSILRNCICVTHSILNFSPDVFAVSFCYASMISRKITPFLHNMCGFLSKRISLSGIIQHCCLVQSMYYSPWCFV